MCKNLKVVMNLLRQRVTIRTIKDLILDSSQAKNSEESTLNTMYCVNIVNYKTFS